MINTSDRLHLTFVDSASTPWFVFQAPELSQFIGAASLRLACAGSSTGGGPCAPCQTLGQAEELRAEAGLGHLLGGSVQWWGQRSTTTEKEDDCCWVRGTDLLWREHAYCLEIWKMPRRFRVICQLQKKGEGISGRSTGRNIMAGGHET